MNLECIHMDTIKPKKLKKLNNMKSPQFKISKELHSQLFQQSRKTGLRMPNLYAHCLELGSAEVQKRLEMEASHEFEVEIAHNICDKIAREEGEQNEEISFKYKGYDVIFDVSVTLVFDENELTDCILTTDNIDVFDKDGEEVFNVLPTFDDYNVAELVKKFI